MSLRYNLHRRMKCRYLQWIWKHKRTSEDELLDAWANSHILKYLQHLLEAPIAKRFSYKTKIDIQNYYHSNPTHSILPTTNPYLSLLHQTRWSTAQYKFRICLTPYYRYKTYLEGYSWPNSTEWRRSKSFVFPRLFTNNYSMTRIASFPLKQGEFVDLVIFNP